MLSYSSDQPLEMKEKIGNVYASPSIDIQANQVISLAGYSAVVATPMTFGQCWAAYGGGGLRIFRPSEFSYYGDINIYVIGLSGS